MSQEIVAEKTEIEQVKRKMAEVYHNKLKNDEKFDIDTIPVDVAGFLWELIDRFGYYKVDGNSLQPMKTNWYPKLKLRAQKEGCECTAASSQKNICDCQPNDNLPIEILLGNYVKSKPNAITDMDLIGKIDYYKSRIAQHYVPKSPDKMSEISGTSFIATIKIDGQFMAMIWRRKDKSFFVNSPTHRVIKGLPVNDDIDKILEKSKYNSMIIMGELYAITSEPANFHQYAPRLVGLTIDRPRVFDITRALNPQSEADMNRIGFGVYDIWELDGIGHKTAYDQTLKDLTSIFGTPDPTKRCGVVISKVFKDIKEISAFYEEQVNLGRAEGLVIHSNMIYKVKPVHSLDVVIIGVVNGIKDSKVGTDFLSSTLVALRKADGNYQVLASVGGGLSNEDRKRLWDYYKDVLQKEHEAIKRNEKIAPNFFITTSDSRIYEMVPPEMIWEIEYLDMITETHNENVLQQVLNFDEKTKTWKMVENAPFVKLISPRFKLQRTDKIVRYEDLRIEQVTDFMPLEGIVEPIISGKSEICFRSIHEKSGMGKKILAWKTNKDAMDFIHTPYPKYVCYYVDFSEKRAGLVTDVLGCQTIIQLRELIQRFADLVKGGYVSKIEIDKLDEMAKKEQKLTELDKEIQAVSLPCPIKSVIQKEVPKEKVKVSNPEEEKFIPFEPTDEQFMTLLQKKNLADWEIQSMKNYLISKIQIKLIQYPAQDKDDALLNRVNEATEIFLTNLSMNSIPSREKNLKELFQILEPKPEVEEISQEETQLRKIYAHYFGLWNLPNTDQPSKSYLKWKANLVERFGVKLTPEQDLIYQKITIFRSNLQLDMEIIKKVEKKPDYLLPINQGDNIPNQRTAYLQDLLNQEVKNLSLLPMQKAIVQTFKLFLLDKVDGLRILASLPQFEKEYSEKNRTNLVINMTMNLSEVILSYYETEITLSHEKLRKLIVPLVSQSINAGWISNALSFHWAKSEASETEFEKAIMGMIVNRIEKDLDILLGKENAVINVVSPYISKIPQKQILELVTEFATQQGLSRSMVERIKLRIFDV